MSGFRLMTVPIFLLALAIIGAGMWQNWVLAHPHDPPPAGQTAAPQPAVTPQPAPILAKWVQVVPAQQEFSRDSVVIESPPAASVRAVLPKGTSCPIIRVGRPDGHSSALIERHNPFPEGFPVIVCEATVEPTAEIDRVYFSDTSYLRIPKLTDLLKKDKETRKVVSFPGFRRMVLVGDTGCRGLKTKRNNRQPCDQDVWQFGRIAAHAAARAENGDADPFLVVHVGDYVYRDRDTWELWREDFFEPGRPLLETAPWIMLRGNHESCTFPEPNSARGWFLFFGFGHNGVTYTCSDPEAMFLEPDTIDVADNLRLLLVDSADAYNATKEPGLLRVKPAAPKDGVRQGKEGSKPAVWLITHIPPRGIAGPAEKIAAKWPEEVNVGWKPESKTLQQAVAHMANDDSLQITTLISGDLHYFQKVEPGHGQSGPVQFVVGNGGVKRDPHPIPPVRSSEISAQITLAKDDQDVKDWHWTTANRHGYVLVCRGPEAKQAEGKGKNDETSTPKGRQPTPKGLQPEGLAGSQPGKWTFMLWAEDADGELHLHPGLPDGYVRATATMPCVLQSSGSSCTPAPATGMSEEAFLEETCFWPAG